MAIGKPDGILTSKHSFLAPILSANSSSFNGSRLINTLINLASRTTISMNSTLRGLVRPASSSVRYSSSKKLSCSKSERSLLSAAIECGRGSCKASAVPFSRTIVRILATRSGEGWGRVVVVLSWTWVWVGWFIVRSFEWMLRCMARLRHVPGCLRHTYAPSQWFHTVQDRER